MRSSTYTRFRHPAAGSSARPSPVALLSACSALLAACNALDEPRDDENGFRVVPTDERPAQLSATPPPALNGGTLLVTADGAFAVAADEARDRVSVVDLRSELWLGEVALEKGAEPGRVVEGEAGTV